MNRAIQTVRWVAAVSTVVMVTSSCGSSETPEAATQKTSTTIEDITTTTGETTITTEAGRLGASRVAATDAESSSGDRVHVELALGELLVGSELPKTTCAGSKERAAAVPYQISITATSSLPIPIAEVRINSNDWLADTPSQYDSECSGGSLAVSAEDLQPGATETFEGYLVARDYFSPAFPQGDPASTSGALTTGSGAGIWVSGGGNAENTSGIWVGTAVCPEPVYNSDRTDIAYQVFEIVPGGGACPSS